MGGALEGHNPPRTPPRRTCKYLYGWEPRVYGAELISAYARMRVLSTEQAMAVECLFHEFVIEFV